MRIISFLLKNWAAAASIPIYWFLLTPTLERGRFWLDEPGTFFGLVALLTGLVCASVASAVKARFRSASSPVRSLRGSARSAPGQADRNRI